MLKVKIKQIIESGLLLKALLDIPDLGASSAELELLRNDPFKASEGHLKFLEKWNGIDLEVVRINKVEDVKIESGLLWFGSNPSGFQYAYNHKEEVFQLDTDGGELKQVASSFESFLLDYVFGEEADKFGGDDWKQDLLENKIIT